MKQILPYLRDQAQQVVALQEALTSIPAIGPENGGQGEEDRAEFIRSQLAEIGVENLTDIPAPDPRVKSGRRPNLIATVPGRQSRTLWLFGHMDVVPPGDPALWQSDPWQIRRDGDRLYGRGTEDNQQAITSMLLLARALRQLDIMPPVNLGLVFMADEENGSQYGLDWILRQRPDMFSSGDFFIVPDGGTPNGAGIQIAEKTQLWLHFDIHGRQCHASTPDEGLNALTAASALILSLNDLNDRFAQKNDLFRPAASTFVPTRHDQNVEAVNILPGHDSFYLDCRLLPEIDADKVLESIRQTVALAEERNGVRIDMETVQRHAASATPQNAPIVGALWKAIEAVTQREPHVYGTGGATVASFLRQRGLPAVVWSTILNTCHQPNECSSIAATLQDSAVFAHVLMEAAHA